MLVAAIGSATPAETHPLVNFTVDNLTEVRIFSERIDLRRCGRRGPPLSRCSPAASGTAGF